MTPCILACNVGSTSLKVAWFDQHTLTERGMARLDWLDANGPSWYTKLGGHAIHWPVGSEPVQNRIARTVRILAEGLDDIGVAIAGVGHRVVHGGPHFSGPVIITPEVRTELDSLSNWAPLHNPPALEGIDACSLAFPNARQVAVFDTAFHATLPEAARTYAIPWDWTHQHHLRRYGFHGLSHSWASMAVRAAVAEEHWDRLVVLHLGAGCSATAIRHGRSVFTTMGLTPLEGFPMASRCGDIDPGLVFTAGRLLGKTPDELEKALWKESGWQAVSGVSADLRQVLQAEAEGNPRAHLAVEMLVRHARRTVAALATELGGLGCLAFTGGIGENSPPIRQRIIEGLAHMGLKLHETANQQNLSPEPIPKPLVISTGHSSAPILVVGAREDWVIARETAPLIG
ncbi:MAG: acetate/propionate family kinase [Planctomycetota bacterium]|nr:acetate/propionate family kinase [Planctomycetota bacterium]